MRSFFITLFFIGLTCFAGIESLSAGQFSAISTEGWLKELNIHRTEKNAEYKDKETTPFKVKKDRRKFDQLNYFEPDEKFKVSAEVIRFDGSDTLKFATSAGTVKQYIRYAELKFDIDGQTLSLEAYKSVQNMNHPIYKNYLFLPFTDSNSGETCYGGGRYLDITIPAGDQMELDFNYAYNPYCAYSEGWFCPIPPARNALEFEINAGEMNYSTL
jgi:uncharacterized protein (DUF1684 family)